MGWTYTFRGKTPMKEFLTGRVNCENIHARWRVLDIAIVRMRTAYMAVEIIQRNQETGALDETTRAIVALVFLLDYRRTDCDTGYKDMDESMGPCESECPERILQLLTPTTDEHALTWRQRCWANIACKENRSGWPRTWLLKHNRSLSGMVLPDPGSKSSASSRFDSFVRTPA